MTTRLRLAALTLALAACGKSSKTTPGLLLNEPSGVAVFRGYTTKTADLHPYLAIANAATNDLTIVDAVDDVGVPSPVALRTLVYPVPGRPALLASADLGDGKADLLVAVSAGDSKLQVIRTWTAEGVIDADVDLGGDVLALAALPFDPDSVGTVRVAAALSGERLAVVTFARAGDGIVVSGAPAVASLGFQPVALAATPDDPDAPGLQTSLWAATRDDLGGGVHGVVGIDVSGSPPWLLQVMNARAPTRLVAAARLRERIDATIDPVAATTLSPAAFANQPMVERVYAILDESGCGLHAPIACGLVALDPDPATSALALDPTPAGSMHAPFRAPIPIPGAALGLAAAQPPAVSPPELDPTYAGTFMRMVTAAGTRITTAAAAVASTDGFVYFVDLGRWEIPGEQVVQPTATLVAATDPQAVATNVRVTPGYTPTARWTATWQGELPGLASRRAQSGAVAGVVPLVPWLALQVPTDGGFSEVARVYDPALGVHAGDFAVIGDLAVIEDPTAIGSCAPRFEATVDVLLSRTGHEAEYPGGALQLGKIAAHPEWDACVDGLAAGKKDLRATIRSSGWVLVRGTGADAALVGRPEVGTELAVQWESEDALSCPAWPPVTSCDATCRSDCERLVRARLARRIGYVPSLGDPQGPALAFMLALRAGVITPTRGFAVAIDTAEGRVPFRVLPPGVTAVAPGDIAVFDRSRDVPSAGVRFFVPYLSNVVLDATPTLQGGDAKALH